MSSSRAEEVGHLSVCLSVGSRVAQQQPEAASPSSHSSDFNNTPLAMTSPRVTPSVSPKMISQTSPENVPLLPFDPSSKTKSTADLQDYKPHEVVTSQISSSSFSFSVARGEYIITDLSHCVKGSYFLSKRATPSSPLSTLITFRVELSKHHFRRCCAFTKFTLEDTEDTRGHSEGRRGR